jgi:hypothetical protein
MKTKAVRRQRLVVWLGVLCLGLTPPTSLSAQEPKLRATLKVPPKEAAGKKIDDRQCIVGAWRFAKWQANGVDLPSQAFRMTFTAGGERIMSMIEEFAAANPAAEQQLPLRFRYVLVWPGEIDLPAPLAWRHERAPIPRSVPPSIEGSRQPN